MAFINTDDRLPDEWEDLAKEVALALPLPHHLVKSVFELCHRRSLSKGLAHRLCEFSVQLRCDPLPLLRVYLDLRAEES